MTTPAEFMKAAPKPLNGNSPWASRYAADVRRVIVEHAARAPRTLQQHLGPSELGSPCDRQVVGKMAALPTTNHVADPWPSIVGTALHAWTAEAFTADNQRRGLMRWLAETRVTPHREHPGTGDLYDAVEECVGDHKFLGETTLAKVRSAAGPSEKYQIQLFLYGLGFIRMGLPVRRIALIAYPRTKATLDDMYVWEAPFDGRAIERIAETFHKTSYRRTWADQVIAGELDIAQIPKMPSDDECYFCPFYRPQSRNGGPGCAGATG